MPIGHEGWITVPPCKMCDQLIAENEQLKAKNEQLLREIERLKETIDAIGYL